MNVNELCNNEISCVGGAGICIGRAGGDTDEHITAFNPNSYGEEACRKFCCVTKRPLADRYTYITNGRPDINGFCGVMPREIKQGRNIFPRIV